MSALVWALPALPFWAMPYRCMNFSTRPSVSTIFCLPV